MAGKVKCRACEEYIPKDEALQIPLGHVCNTECLAAYRAREQRKKAKRSNGNPIPPDVRKAVKDRDGSACRYCRSSRWLNVHHIIYRSHGGKHVERNLICLCRNHHDMVHADGRYWQPILLALIEDQYNTGRFQLVGQFETVFNKTRDDEWQSLKIG